MPHSVAAPTASSPTTAAGDWVRCRARTWQVLDVRRDGDSVQWRLAGRTELPRVLATPPDVVTPVPLATRRMSRRAWARRILSHVQSREPIWWPRHAPSLPIDRLPFQYVPAMAMLSGHHRRLLLADSVGMGKTIQAAVLLHEIHAREPDAATLVITPAALLVQWQRELLDRACLDATPLDAAALRREAAMPRRVVQAARLGGCWLMSIDLLRQPEVTGLLACVPWTLLVVDEAHLAAPGTARLTAVARVAAVSVRVLLLTGTPTAAGAAGADALRLIGARGTEPPMAVLSRRTPVESRPVRKVHVLPLRSRRAEATLHLCLDRFAARARLERGATGLLPALVLRRRAASCPGALVRSIERRLEVLGMAGTPATPGLFDEEDDPVEDDEDAVLRMEAWRDPGAERSELERLLVLARSCDPLGGKGATLTRLLRRCREPVLIFTAYLDTLRRLRLALSPHRIAIVHGQMPEEVRGAAIDAFTEGRADVLLTTDASAEGLNLHARCRLVVHADVPGSPRLFNQRTGRVDRHGQSRRVHAMVLSTRSAHDRESLRRMQSRQEEDERWLASATPTGTWRLTTVAERQMAAHERAATMFGGANVSSDATRDRAAAPFLARHRAAGRRWRRLARGLGLPTNLSCLIVGTWRSSGGALLTHAEHPVVVGAADVDTALAAVTSAMAWQTLAAAHWRRARRLARRLGAWERDADRAVSAEATTRGAGLFDDAEGRAAEEQGRVRRDEEPSGAFSTAGILERRA